MRVRVRVIEREGSPESVLAFLVRVVLVVLVALVVRVAVIVVG